MPKFVFTAAVGRNYIIYKRGGKCIGWRSCLDRFDNGMQLKRTPYVGVCKKSFMSLCIWGLRLGARRHSTRGRCYTGCNARVPHHDRLWAMILSVRVRAFMLTSPCRYSAPGLPSEIFQTIITLGCSTMSSPQVRWLIPS